MVSKYYFKEQLHFTFFMPKQCFKMYVRNRITPANMLIGTYLGGANRICKFLRALEILDKKLCKIGNLPLLLLTLFTP